MSSIQAQRPSLRHALRSFCPEFVSPVLCRHLSSPPRRLLSPTSGEHLTIPPTRFSSLALSGTPLEKALLL
ncbi:UNVERIFIED_CONTAM: hypothetical protein Sradi_2137700 [Sesamum radiatum]|uniref:Uncharacterized protein n=1 Tax=Sesamum radiatum TaxID=300843 RepID=A0AAW2TJX4_SESRA